MNGNLRTQLRQNKMTKTLTVTASKNNVFRMSPHSQPAQPELPNTSSTETVSSLETQGPFSPSNSLQERVGALEADMYQVKHLLSLILEKLEIRNPFNPSS